MMGKTILQLFLLRVLEMQYYYENVTVIIFRITYLEYGAFSESLTHPCTHVYVKMLLFSR